MLNINFVWKDMSFGKRMNNLSIVYNLKLTEKIRKFSFMTWYLIVDCFVSFLRRHLIMFRKEMFWNWRGDSTFKNHFLCISYILVFIWTLAVNWCFSICFVIQLQTELPSDVVVSTDVYEPDTSYIARSVSWNYPKY